MNRNKKVGTTVDASNDLASLALDIFERLNGLSYREINIVLIRVQRLVSTSARLALNGDEVSRIKKEELNAEGIKSPLYPR